MMIEDFVSQIDSTISDFAQLSYEALAAGLAATLWGIAALIFVAMVINVLIQAKEMGIMAYVGWTIRMAVIITMASTWSAFQPIAAAAQNLPDTISSAINGGSNVWQSLDLIVGRCFQLSKEAFENADFGLSLTGAILWVIGALIGAIGTGTALIAKGGLAACVGLAPIFIASLLTSGTSQLFGAWCKVIIGLIMVVVMLSSIIFLIQALFTAELADSPSIENLAGLGRFLAVCILSIVMVRQIPGLASGMSGSVVAASSGLAAASGLAQGIKNAMSAANNSVRSAAASARTGMAMYEASKDGTGKIDSARRAMAARKSIQHMARNNGSASRQSIAAGRYRNQTRIARQRAMEKQAEQAGTQKKGAAT